MTKYFQIARYVFAGGIAVLSNLTILFVCVHYFKLWYLYGAIFAFSFAVIVSYLLQKFFVFKNYSRQDMHKQFLAFFVFNLAMLSVNTLLIYTFVGIIGFYYLLAQALASAICGFVNYIFFNKVIFKKITI